MDEEARNSLAVVLSSLGVLIGSCPAQEAEQEWWWKQLQGHTKFLHPLLEENGAGRAALHVADRLRAALESLTASTVTPEHLGQLAKDVELLASGEVTHEANRSSARRWRALRVMTTPDFGDVIPHYES